MRFAKSDLLNNVIKLCTGSSIVVAIPLLLSPILTRLYKPEEFGFFALYTTVCTIVALCSTMQYEHAINLPDEDNDAKDVLLLSILSTLSGTCIYSIILTIALQLFPSLGFPLIWITPISITLIGMYESCYRWYLRKEKFKTMIYGKFIYVSLAASFKIALGYTGYTQTGLILGFLFAQIIGVSYFALKIFFINEDKLSFAFQPLLLKRKALIYKNFPIATLPLNLLKFIQNNLLIFFIGSAWGANPLGQYSMSLRVLNAPIYLIGNPMSDAIYQNLAASLKNSKSRRRHTQKIFLKSSTLLLIPMVVLFFTAPQLFSIVFGDNWHEAGVYTQMLTPWFFGIIATLSLEKYVMVINKQKLSFFINLTTTILQFIVLLISAKILSIKLCLLLVSLVGLSGKSYLAYSVLLKTSEQTEKGNS